MKVGIHSIQSVTFSFLHKLNSIVNSEKEDIFSKYFIDILRNYIQFLSENNERNSIMSIKYIEDWIRAISTEFENWYDKLKTSNLIIKESAMRIKSLEQNMQNLSVNEEERLGNDRRIASQLKELTEDKHNLMNEREDVVKQYEKVVRELKQYKADNKRFLDETNSLKNEIANLNQLNNNLNREFEEKEEYLNNASFQIRALEERIVILVKEKKYLENLIIR